MHSLAERLQETLQQCGTMEMAGVEGDEQSLHNTAYHSPSQWFAQDGSIEQPAKDVAMDWDPAADCSIQLEVEDIKELSSPRKPETDLEHIKERIPPRKPETDLKPEEKHRLNRSALNCTVLRVLAADKPPLEVVRSMLEQLADPNVKDPVSKQNPLHFAVKVGDEDIVAELLQAGGNVNSEDHVGLTPLMAAASGGNAPIVAQLLARGADVGRTKHSGEDALRLAAQFGHEDVVDLLLESGASPETRDRFGVTALIKAQQCGHVSIVNKLLAATRKNTETKGKNCRLCWADMSEDLIETTDNSDSMKSIDFISETEPDSPKRVRNQRNVEPEYFVSKSEDQQSKSHCLAALLDPFLSSDDMKKSSGKPVPSISEPTSPTSPIGEGISSRKSQARRQRRLKSLQSRPAVISNIPGSEASSIKASGY